MKNVPFAAGLILVAALTRSASAGGDAKAFEAEGTRLYGEQRYAEAADAFRHAFEADPQAKYVYDIAQAERLAGDCTGAIADYRRFLDLRPTEAQRDQASDNIRACEVILKEAPPPAPPSASVSPPPAPPTASVQTTPAPPIPARHPEKPLTPEARPPLRDPLGGVLLGTGIAALGTGIGLLAWSYADEANARDTATQSSRTYQEHVDQVARAGVTRVVGPTAMGVGAAFIGGAILRYVVVGNSVRAEVGVTSLMMTARF